MSYLALEEEIVSGLAGDTQMAGELLTCYADWLERRLDCIRDWIRAGDRDQLVQEARNIAVATNGLWMNRITRSAMQLQFAALKGGAPQQSRIVGRLLSQVASLRVSAEYLSTQRFQMAA